MLSIIISHKNRIKQLQRCVNCLINQKTNYKYEIIIVDGGSTSSVIGELKNLEESQSIIKVFYFNDTDFNVSKYRNYGVKKSYGDLITFLDADILVADDFVNIICSKYNGDNIVLIHTAYGFRINIEDDLAYLFDKINNTNIKDMIKIMEFSDFRDSAIEFYGEKLENCPAPWVYGWSGIISISRKLFEKSGCFDENFQGWGSEDTDLAYRLWRQGGTFIHENDAFGIHVAHASNKNKKENQNYLNRRFLYSKYKTLETELYAYLTGVSINNFLIMCQKLHIGAWNPIYTSQQIDTINNIIKNKKSLCVGLDSCQEIQRLNFTDYLTLNENTEKIINEYKENVKFERHLGLITEYTDKYFDIVIIFDAYNYLPKELYEYVISEMSRISKNVYQITTKKFVPAFYNKINVGKNTENSRTKEIIF